jgi:hypothetical protein
MQQIWEHDYIVRTWGREDLRVLADVNSLL